MPYRRQRRYRRSFRSRRVPYRRTYRKRYRRHARRRTVSRIIKATLESPWALGINKAQVQPFTLSPAALPGFNDYIKTNTHFRLVKAVLRIGLPQDTTPATRTSFLVVSSQAFAVVSGAGPVKDGIVGLGYKDLDELRQARWQRVIYPSTTRTSIRIGFKPYTLAGTFGPYVTGVATSNMVYPRIWPARRWMPMSWAQSSSTDAIFYGPYFAPVDGPDFVPNVTVNCTLEVYFQVKGQR